MKIHPKRTKKISQKHWILKYNKSTIYVKWKKLCQEHFWKLQSEDVQLTEGKPGLKK